MQTAAVVCAACVSGQPNRRFRGGRDARVLALHEVGPGLGRFRTVIMFGNNLGLFRSRRRRYWLPQRRSLVTTDNGRILAGTMDMHCTEDPIHVAYHARNLGARPMPGQIRMRIRHLQYATPWFDYMTVSPQETAQLAHAGGWRLDRPSSTVPTMSACWSRSVPEGEGVRSSFVNNRATPFDARAHSHHATEPRRYVPGCPRT